MPATLVVPAAGKDKGPFLNCAKQVLQDCYAGDGVIFTAFSQQGTNGTVKFAAATNPPKGGSSDYVTEMRRATDYIVLSHMGELDGPILYNDGHTDGLLDMQPWACVPGDPDQLQMPGIIHWTTTGVSRTNKVRIMLFGCDSGITYGKAVCKSSRSVTYGFKDACPSAIPDFSVKAVKSIQAGRPQHGLGRFDP
ncbi:hypothetical protein [Methylobacterium brachythecii]|uniref:Uncharacterized protein n=1 Tax=Methylobacterium brachythecii TaxID=1176177 RepID=A0A7W6AQQ4_9HYPH|nr:hypothetical protein [Methylobacterium brachythecii]MBB3904981.1 hypothetical protein [Methylobacterium brachythecii]GLS45767.1 hypothetical protein GCM10007884_37580 [Methylobacterium brachythecii]